MGTTEENQQCPLVYWQEWRNLHENMVSPKSLWKTSSGSKCRGTNNCCYPHVGLETSWKWGLEFQCQTPDTHSERFIWFNVFFLMTVQLSLFSVKQSLRMISVPKAASKPRVYSFTKTSYCTWTTVVNTAGFLAQFRNKWSLTSANGHVKVWT